MKGVWGARLRRERGAPQAGCAAGGAAAPVTETSYSCGDSCGEEKAAATELLGFGELDPGAVVISVK